MKLGKETIEKVHRFEADFEPKEWALLKKHGLKLIKEDEGALVNYAVNHILRKEVERHQRS